MGNQGSSDQIEWDVSSTGIKKIETQSQSGGEEKKAVEGCAGALLGDSFYVFGGGDLTEQSSDLLEISVATQRHRRLVPVSEASSNPSARTGAALAASAEQRALLLFGGLASGVWLNETHLYYVDSNSWEKVAASNAPLPRDKCCLIPFDDRRALLFGGFGPVSPVADDDGEGHHGNADESHDGHDGGNDDDDDDDDGDAAEENDNNNNNDDDDDDDDDEDNEGQPSLSFKWFSDIWLFDFVSKTWEQIPTTNTPEGRAAASLTLLSSSAESSHKDLYVFGGRDPSGRTNSVWKLATSEWKWQRLDPAGKAPEKRSFHVGCGISNSRMVVWGGRDQSEEGLTLKDLSVFDAAAVCWLQPKLEHPIDIGRHFSAFAFDAVRSQVVVYGGSTADSGDSDPVVSNDLLAIDVEALVLAPPVTIPQPEPSSSSQFGDFSDVPSSFDFSAQPDF